MSHFSEFFSKSWQFFLIQGGVSSGKSQIALWVADQMLKSEDQSDIHSLLNMQNSAILTERLSVSSSDDLFLKIKSRFYLVEYITSMNVFDKVKYLHEEQGVTCVLVDYVNLLTHQSNNLDKMIEYMEEKNIKGIFVENTSKTKPSVDLYKKSDIVISTSLSKINPKILELSLLKYFSEKLPYNKKNLTI